MIAIFEVDRKREIEEKGKKRKSPLRADLAELHSRGKGGTPIEVEIPPRWPNGEEEWLKGDQPEITTATVRPKNRVKG